MFVDGVQLTLPVRLDLAYACASTYTHSEAATDAETASLGSLGNVKVELASDFARLPV